MPEPITIVLARHGRPVWDEKTPIPGSALAEWVKGRDAAPIDPADPPPPAELLRIARACRLLAASPLRRSIESARVVVPDLKPQINPAFEEVHTPTEIHSGVRLPPKAWKAMTRSAWYAGWSPGVESFAEARRRAKLATMILIELASAHQSVVLVGHGIMNGLIGRQLRKNGWSGPRARPRKLFAFAVYTRRER